MNRSSTEALFSFDKNVFRGKKVSRTAADVFDGTQTPLFTISGGKVCITGLICTVSGAALDGTASNTSFVSNPTVGTDTAMSGVLDIASDEAGSIYSCPFDASTALLGGTGGGIRWPQARGWVMPVGTIDLLSSADAGTGGALGAFDLWYFPIDSGASVAVA